jgi:hypothetical protein
MKNKSFNKRAFISTALFTSGLILPITGHMNHHLQFEPFSTTRHFWMAAHTAAGVIFLLFAIAHLLINRKAFINYINRSKALFPSREALAAIAFVIIIAGLISSHAFIVN